RKSGVTSQLVLLNVLFLYCPTTQGPLQAYVCDAVALELNAFENRSPIVSPNMPNDALTTVLPSPMTSQAAPALGTVSVQVSTSFFGKLWAGKMLLNCPASFDCGGVKLLYCSHRTPRLNVTRPTPYVSVM